MEEAEVEMRSKCQDCGNQAKKGCEYKRCRTCCNNKAFVCETHVHSTWVPHHRRHHRDDRNHHPHNFPYKKHKHNTPYPPDEEEEVKFPEWVNMNAKFRCVRVRSNDDWVNEVVYHTSVRIEGHVFSGLLHDQGPFQGGFGESSSVPHLHDAEILVAPPLLSSSSTAHPDSIFQYPTHTFPLSAMPYFSNPQP